MDLRVSQVKKVKNKIKSLKKSKYIYNTSHVLQDEEVRQYIKVLQTKFCIILIDKASTNFLLFAKKFYISKLLDEAELRDTQSV